MTERPRVVLDTNVIVSALLLPASTPRMAFERAHTAGLILISVPVLAELEAVLSRDKFDKYVTEDERKEFLIALAKDAELVEITESVAACRDPRDDKLLELALCGRADFVVTGDPDLLVLNPFRNIVILTPADFIAQP